MERSAGAAIDCRSFDPGPGGQPQAGWSLSFYQLRSAQAAYLASDRCAGL